MDLISGKIAVRSVVQHLIIGLGVIFAMVCGSAPSVSDEFTDRRITAGARIFRALLAADRDIREKRGDNGKLKLGLVFLNDTRGAEKAARVLGRGDNSRIREISIRVEKISFSEFLERKGRDFAAVFLTQPMGRKRIRQVGGLAAARKILVFSPFEGDVERGVAAGISVEAKVRPYLNLTALENGGVSLKSFFMRVAKTYETNP